jgi:hypothetical protein
MGQIDQIAVEDSVVVPVVGIGQQLAADEVVQREGGNAADRVFLAGNLQADPALQLDRHARHDHPGAEIPSWRRRLRMHMPMVCRRWLQRPWGRGAADGTK